MSVSCTLICGKAAFVDAVSAITSPTALLTVEGDILAWKQIRLERSGFTTVFTSLVRGTAGDRFSKLVLRMYNFVRKVHSPVSTKQDFILNRISNAPLLIGVVGTGDSLMDETSNEVWSIAAALDAFVFSANAVHDANKECILTFTGGSNEIV